MELTRKELNAKLNSDRNMFNMLGLGGKEPKERKKIERARGKYQKTNNPIPPEIKATVGILSRLGGERRSDIAREFGMSDTSVAKIEHGLVPAPENIIEQGIERIQTKVLSVIENALESMTDDKLKNNSALANANIIGRLFPLLEKNKKDDEENGINSPQVIVYAPTVRDERSYTVVESK